MRTALVDEHSEAVERWVDTMIVGLDLCPFAQQSGVRVISTAAVTGEEVLKDLVAEERRGFERAVSEAKILDKDGDLRTTLLVCPHVLEWKEQLLVKFRVSS